MVLSIATTATIISVCLIVILLSAILIVLEGPLSISIYICKFACVRMCICLYTHHIPMRVYLYIYIYVYVDFSFIYATGPKFPGLVSSPRLSASARVHLASARGSFLGRGGVDVYTPPPGDAGR